MYDYLEHMKDDIRDYINWNVDIKDYIENDELFTLESKLYDELFCEDCITGNASGSYTCNAWEAEENLCHNTDLLFEAIEEFGYNPEILKDGAEACDVTIRCYLLPQAISEVLEEFE